MKTSSLFWQSLVAAIGLWAVSFFSPSAPVFHVAGKFSGSSSLFTPDTLAPETKADTFTYLSGYPATVSFDKSGCSASIKMELDYLGKALRFSVGDCPEATLQSFRFQFLFSEDTWQDTAYAQDGNFIFGLPSGQHRMILEIADTCAGVYQDTVEFQVADQEIPIAICNKNLTATLTPIPFPPFDKNPVDRIYTNRINQGSSDNCELAWVKVRRIVGPEHHESLIVYGYDYNRDGQITPADGKDTDNNGQIDPEEYFTEVPGSPGKLYSPALEYVDFFCPDLDNAPEIELLVKDVNGNMSTCSRTVQVNDGGRISVEGPADLEISCDNPAVAYLTVNDTLGTPGYQQAAAAFGDIAVKSGNECSTLKIDYSVTPDLNCGAGSFTRTWTVSKNSPAGPLTQTFSQTIKVAPVSGYDILFPADQSLQQCSPTQLPDSKAEIRSRSCDQLTVNVDERISSSSANCSVLYRTFTITNWCAYQEDCGNNYVNAITINRKDPIPGPGKPGDAFFVLVRDLDKDGREEVYLSRDSVPEPVEKANFQTSCSSGRFHTFRYTQIINLSDGEAPVITSQPAAPVFSARSNDCRGRMNIGFKVQDNCYAPLQLASVRITPQGKPQSGTDPRWYDPTWTVQRFGLDSFAIKVDNLPTGAYDLLVSARDACGNVSTEKAFPFEVKDQTGPVPFCIFNVPAQIKSASGTVVRTWDILAGKSFDCSGQFTSMTNPANRNQSLVTEFSINRRGEAADRFQKEITLTCADAGKVVEVELHAWDKFDNHSFCIARLSVQSNPDLCGQEGNSIGVNTQPWSNIRAEEAGFRVESNFPNPFRDETLIRFYLPAASPVTLTVRDLHGRVLLRQDAEYPAGENSFSLEGAALPAGWLSYTLEATAIGQQQTLRMMKME